ncbi:MAG: 50S ribosomal protein L30 [Bacillota bacterium]
MQKIKVTLIRSVIGTPEDQRATVRALGLKKTNSSVVLSDTLSVRGMLRKVAHLVEVEQTK